MTEDFDDEDDLFRSIPLEDTNISSMNTTSTSHLSVSHLDCHVPEQFLFPFDPYPIQVSFMQELYRAMTLGKIGIFESPTGTGKSLSLICGALRWLKDHEEQQKRELEALLAEEKAKNDQISKEISSGELDWISAHKEKKQTEQKTSQLQKEQDKRRAWEQKLEQLKSRKPSQAGRKRTALDQQFEELFRDSPLNSKNIAAEDENSSHNSVEDEDDSELVTDYLSDNEGSDITDKQEVGDEDEEHHVMKIYYCSRTHSQLAQFVRELMKSPYGGDTRVVSLGSRQNLCVNDSVKKLNNLSLINDKCLDLQKKKSEKKQKTGLSEKAVKKRTQAGANQPCPFYKQEPIAALRDTALMEVKDIEELVSAGRDMKACPYYASRHAVPDAEVVVLPYNTLLHRSTRQSCGIKLKGNIVLIDEAHNLLDTIAAVHSVQISGAQLCCAHSQLSQYIHRYRSRFRPSNMMYLKQLLFILAALIKALGGQPGQPAAEQTIKTTGVKLQTMNDFLFDCNLDNLNLFKLTNFCEKSRIAQKLHGFVEKYQPTLEKKGQKEEQRTSTWALSNYLKELSQGKQVEPDVASDVTLTGQGEGRVASGSPLMQILGFLSALTTADKDGRILISTQGSLNECTVKFLLLNPAVHFTQVVQEARAVILAGGTMQPVSEFKDQLFTYCGVSPDRILEFSCGHVIPGEQLLPIALGHGPSGVKLDFTYQNRGQPGMLDELGRVLYNVCNLVPGGVVCFLPSYEYAALLHEVWIMNGHLSKIAAVKKVFREPKKSNQVESILSEYSSCIKKHMQNKYSGLTGAVLFCVVGGKMSEGINFSDDLGRCVMMVGLPFPNMKSAELKEKMNYLNSTQPKSPDGKAPGQVHYENLCMKAVNQSIGRAIRHRLDYASILLLDHRYHRPSIRNQLPQWIGQHVQNLDRFGPAFAALREFFDERKASA